jgi:hypothetical protein
VRPRRATGLRVVAASAASLLFVAGAVAIDRSRAPQPPGAEEPGSGGGETEPAAAPSPSETVDTAAAEALLDDVAAAASASADELLAAGVAVARGPWRPLTDPAWPITGERPVYVADLTVTDRSQVRADVVVAQRADEPTDALVLRLLPAAEALADNALSVEVEVDGAPVDAVADPGGLLRVPLAETLGAGDAVSLRIRLAYRLLTVEEVAAESGPAAFGIHGRDDDLAVLGHWAPLITFEPEPVVPWGDVGSFPVAMWSVRVLHDGDAVTGGDESDCEPPDGAAPVCTRSRGVALRDLAVVVVDADVQATREVRGVTVRVTGEDTLAESVVDRAADESAVGIATLTDAFGPLAWPDVEVVAVPLGRGAAGMEFPGLVLVDDESAAGLEGGFGSYVLAHELGHQWFHALVGNGSFADPVVDESLAQYSTVLVYRELFGPAVTEQVVDQTMGLRYQRFLDSGREEQPPATASGDFSSPEVYGPVVYARGALAWIALEEAFGPEAVQGFLRSLVRDRGLEETSVDEVIQRAVAADERFGQVLSRYWESPDPVPIP